jgi:hypothetical protein
MGLSWSGTDLPSTCVAVALDDALHVPLNSIAYRAGIRAKLRTTKMLADDEDVPAVYLLFVVAAIVVIAAIALSAFFILIR